MSAMSAGGIIQGVIIGVVVTLAGTYYKAYLDKPATLSAEVLAVQYTAPVGSTAAADAECMLQVTIRNGTPKPARNIRIAADYALAYSVARDTKARAITTGSISQESQSQRPFEIDVIDPGQSKRAFVFTSFNCNPDWDPPAVRVFNDEGSATVRSVSQPSGWLITISDYYIPAYGFMGLGMLIAVLIILGGIVDLIKKASHSPPPAATPPAETQNQT